MATHDGTNTPRALADSGGDLFWQIPAVVALVFTSAGDGWDVDTN